MEKNPVVSLRRFTTIGKKRVYRPIPENKSE